MIDKDVILYSYDNVYGLDKKDMEKNRNMSEYYNPKSTADKLTSEVINPSDELAKIMKKLSPKEKFVLKTYLKK